MLIIIFACIHLGFLIFGLIGVIIEVSQENQGRLKTLANVKKRKDDGSYG